LNSFLKYAVLEFQKLRCGAKWTFVVAQRDICDELLGSLLLHEAGYAYRYKSLTYRNVF